MASIVSHLRDVIVLSF